jgi:hypothetical protein
MKMSACRKREYSGHIKSVFIKSDITGMKNE